MAIFTTLYLLLTLFLVNTLAAARVYGDVDQKAVFNYDAVQSSTITVRGEANTPHPAEIASVQISVSVTIVSRDAALQEATASFSHVQDLLKQLSPVSDNQKENRHEPLVEQTFASSPSVYSNKEFGELEEYYLNVEISARFRQVELLRHFIRNVTQIPYTTIDWIDWELSPETKAKVETSSRKEAMQDTVRLGQEWAAILGMKSIQLVNLAEEDTWDGIEYSRVYGRIDYLMVRDVENEVQPPNVQMNMAVRCSFRI